MFSVLKQNLISPSQPGMLRDPSHNQFPRPRLAHMATLPLLFATTLYATFKVLRPEDGCNNSSRGATVQRESLQNGVYYSPDEEHRMQTRWTKDRELSDIS